jgi:CHAT domain-containing protein/tetratricopeptide (TPR) repeat protein
MDDHLASCRDCAFVFAETARFSMEEEDAEAAVLERKTPQPFVRRPAFRAVAGLAAAAGLVLATWLVWRGRPRPGGSLLVAELSRALGDRRLVEPRLTGFGHAPLVVVRGSPKQGLDAHPPAVLSAVARIRERAEADPSPQTLGPLGITYLVSGDVARAVETLESATAQAPDDPRLLSDLAAAYLVRAARLDEPADVPRALEAAERAIALEASPDEAWFNRALALEQLPLADAARKAWEDYLARDPASGWADEARRHLESLPPPRQSSVDYDRARVRAALEAGPGRVERLAGEDPSLLREHLHGDLLAAWGEAYLAGRPAASGLRESARLVAAALEKTTGDGLLLDAAGALEAGPSPDSRAAVRAQALGYRTLHEAERLYGLERGSCATFREALRLLDDGRSPYAARAREQTVNACLYPGAPEAGLDELGRIETAAERHGYPWLLARVRWLQGLFHARRGEHTRSLERFRLARDGFRAVRDTDGEAAMLALIAESYHMLGHDGRAWRERSGGLALLDVVRSDRGRRRTLVEAMVASQDRGMLRTAVHFETTLVEAVQRWGSAAATSDALLARAATFDAIGSPERALDDVAAARHLVHRIDDNGLREEMEAEVAAAEGAILAGTRPDQAVEPLEAALGYFDRTAPDRGPGIHQLIARAQLARGLDDEAARHLEEGIRELESQRLSLREVPLRVSFFERAVPLFDEMVALQVERRRDPERALEFVERGRARQLHDSIAGPPARAATEKGAVPALATPLDAGELRRAVPGGVALVYLVSRRDRLLSWTLTREDVRFEERPLPEDELRRLVAAHGAALAEHAALPVVREASARLYDVLLGPQEDVLRSQKALVFVPDSVLQPLPFAALWNRRTRRYLAEEHLVGLAPSGTVFVRASASAGQARTDGMPSVLVVGNPRLGLETEEVLPGLPGAESEAAEVARLHRGAVLLTGRTATKHRFLDLMRTSQVVHFAGHAVSAEAPWSARLLFAPDPARADGGALHLHELQGRAYRRTRLVVLAACRTAAGGVSRVEGAWSLARPFLASGVPSVVASLWDVDDAASRDFFVAFHQALLADGDGLTALGRTQAACIRAADPSRAHPASWAGFVSIGGLDPRALDTAPHPPSPL